MKKEMPQKQHFLHNVKYDRQIAVKTHTMLKASVPEVALIVHKMSVCSVTGTALSSAVYLRFHSHTLLGLLRN